MTPSLPFSELPKPVRGKPIKAVALKIDAALLQAAREEQLHRGLSFRQVVEWALAAFVVRANPAKARKLGLKD